MANRGTYIDNLPSDIRDGIRRQIRQAMTKRGYTSAEVREYTDIAMTYRLGDIDDIIPVQYWIDKANKGNKTKKRRK